MAVDIGPKIGIDGEAQFRKQLGDINQALKTMGAEQKAVASAFRDEADAEKKMAAQKDVLNRQIEAQKEKLAMLEKGLRDSAKMYGEADARTQKWQQAVHEATASLNDMVGQMEGMDGTIEDTADALGDAEEATSGWADVMKGQLLADFVKTGLQKTYEMVKNIASAMWDASKAGAAYADDVLTMSTVTGLSTDQLQQYMYMADLIDVSVDTISGSMTKLISSMSKAQGGNAEMAESFKELGVSVADETGKLRDNEDVFNDVITALGKIDNETERDAKAMKIFGKSARDLNPLIAAGADKLKDLAKEANDTGYVLSGKALDALGKQQDAMDRLDKKTESLKNSFAVKLAPSMERAYSAMGEALDNPRVQRGLDVLAEGVSSVIDGVVDLASRALPDLFSVFNFGDTRLSTFTDEELALAAAADEISKSYQDMIEGYKDSAIAIVDETNRTKDLWKELQTLADENGNVKEKDQERANFILKELNEALGTEYSMNDGIIGQYQDMQKEIDALITKREAEALMAAASETFADAEMKKAEATRTAAAAFQVLEKAEADAAAAQQAADEAFEAYKNNTESWKEDELLAKYQSLRDSADKLVAKQKEAQTAYDKAHEAEAGYYADADKWERARVAAANGNHKQVVSILTDEFSVTLDYYKRKKELNEQEKEDLKAKIEEQELAIAQYKRNLEAGMTGVSEAGLKEMEDYVKEAKRILDGKEVASQWLNGMIAGLSDPTAIRSVARASGIAPEVIKQTTRKNLMIESPSKVATWNGQMWVEGLIKGLEAKEDELAKAATSLADTITASSTPAGETALSYGNDLTAAGYRCSYGESNSYTTNLGGITVRVEGADGVNEDILAQRIAVRLTDELNRARRGRA